MTNELDEGPIIAQQIIPVTHSHTSADMMKAGKEIETAVLAKALHLVFEDRGACCIRIRLLFSNRQLMYDKVTLCGRLSQS